MSLSDGQYDCRYLCGIEHFNRGEYFQCHEVWEDLWREADEPAKTFLKGLIQVAVAIHHQQRGNQHGAEKLWESSRICLARYPSRYWGLNSVDLLAQIADCWAGLTGRCVGTERTATDGDGNGLRPLIVLDKKE